MYTHTEAHVCAHTRAFVPTLLKTVSVPRDCAGTGGCEGICVASSSPCDCAMLESPSPLCLNASTTPYSLVLVSTGLRQSGHIFTLDESHDAEQQKMWPQLHMAQS